MGAQKNRLIEIVLLSTHNICFGSEIRKIIFKCALLAGEGCIILIREGSICNENPIMTPSINALGFYAIWQTKDQSVAVIMVY